MKLILFKPHPDLDRIDPEHKAKWIAALRTSVQHKGSMSNEDDTAHCCLCVSTIVEGAKFENYGASAIPSSLLNCTPKELSPNSLSVQTLTAASMVSQSFQLDLPIEYLEVLGFSSLNDKWLTHNQIADLLEGKEVKVFVTGELSSGGVSIAEDLSHGS